MNSALQTAHTDLNLAFSGTDKAMTLGEACKQIERGHSTLTTLCVLMNCSPDDELAKVIRRLNTYIDRCEQAVAHKHWAHDANRHLALIEHHQKLSAVADRSYNNLHHLRAIIEHFKADKAANLLPTDGQLEEAMRLIDEELRSAA